MNVRNSQKIIFQSLNRKYEVFSHFIKQFRRKNLKLFDYFEKKVAAFVSHFCQWWVVSFVTSQTWLSNRRVFETFSTSKTAFDIKKGCRLWYWSMLGGFYWQLWKLYLSNGTQSVQYLACSKNLFAKSSNQGSSEKAPSSKNFVALSLPNDNESKMERKKFYQRPLTWVSLWALIHWKPQQFKSYGLGTPIPNLYLTLLKV